MRWSLDCTKRQMRLHLPTLRWLGLFDFKGGRTMRHRILMSMALLAALLFAGLTTHKPASALSCGPCPATTTDNLNLRAAPPANG